MPDAQFNCPECDGLFQVDEDLAGQQVECPFCATVIQLPDASEDTPAPPPPPPAGEETPPPISPTADGLDPLSPPVSTSPPSPSPPPASSLLPPPPGDDSPLGEDDPSTTEESQPPPVDTTGLMLQCPICSGPFQVAPGDAGEQVECPHCGETVAVELDAPPPPTPAESSQPPATEEIGDLPPSAMGIDGIVPGREVATPQESEDTANQTIEIALEDEVIQLTEKDGKEQVVAKRRLNRARQGRTRTKRNVMMWIVSILVLVGALVALYLKG